MRLTCPNCGAQYEVPDDVIPNDGRDVQCSNCGTTWFQPHADSASSLAPPPTDSALRSALNPPEDPEPETTSDVDMPDQVPTPSRRTMDPEVQDILKEEAAHETQLRAQESGGLETQPDLGLDDTTDDVERRAMQARTRMERLKGPDVAPAPEPDIEEAVAAAAKSSRKDRLPDIDEINSSLRNSAPSAGPQEAADSLEDAAPAKSGFARGFAVPLIVAAILVLLYVLAPQITDLVPALGPALTSYVLFVDQLRETLNTRLGAFVDPGQASEAVE